MHLAGIFRDQGINHIHAPWANGPATAAGLASQLSGIPFSFCGHAHDIYPPDGALVEKLRVASFVRTISHTNERYLADPAPAAASKIVHITIGHRSPRPPGSPGCRSRRFSSWPGGAWWKKGFPDLLAACRYLAEWGVDFHLTLAGDGPQRSHLAGLVKEYALDDRVEFLGHVPHNRVPRSFPPGRPIHHALHCGQGRRPGRPPQRHP